MEIKKTSIEQMENTIGEGFNGCDAALTGAAFIQGAAITAATGGTAAFFIGAAWSIGTGAFDFICLSQ